MRQEKQLLLDEIEEGLNTSATVIITRYQQLSAEKMSQFRRTISKTGGDFKVVRKRIFLKAAEKQGLSLDKNTLLGHVAILLTKNDPVEMTKAVFEFSKENNNAVQVLAGHLDGNLYSAADVEKLSKLPALPDMRAQLLSLFEAPMAQTLSVMEAVLTSVMHCLQNKADKEEQV